MMLTVLEWMLVGTGFTGALLIGLLVRAVRSRLIAETSVSSHFSPKGGCTDAIVRELNQARREILMQAYSFTCSTIATALAAARARGVAVKVILDRANEKETYSELGSLEKQGLDVLIDAHHAIAHNKIIIVDRHTIITGSFNFTRQAEHENAENLLVIKGRPNLVHEYVQNFLAHQAHSQKPGTVVAADGPRVTQDAPVPRHRAA
jgi:phosphatidylserine/phosphatidylglycerophosphate/cardiolipin synthase-like enzyme